ncbi:guanylate kinase-like [Oppia nitens]|uniref:guanylate kinase-like n=1 Tax=Oppia nitens TaxID=1686743 RepID=UPI0023DCE73B|nr:guanylate kinase-like [Oppia nitens]
MSIIPNLSGIYHNKKPHYLNGNSGTDTLSDKGLNICWSTSQLPIGPSPLVLTGPSGSGKSTLLRQLMDEFKDCFGFSISHTTRHPRAAEVNGREYHFITHEEFEKSVEKEEFLEFTRFSNNYYGTSKKAVKDVQNSGRICILDVEIEGVKNLKKTDLNPRFVFIKPPNMDILEKRLRSRGTETEEAIQNRLRRATDEMEFGEMNGVFDLVIVNNEIEEAYNELKQFIVQDIQALKFSRGM